MTETQMNRPGPLKAEGSWSCNHTGRRSQKEFIFMM